jgi:hypothetical protein
MASVEATATAAMVGLLKSVLSVDNVVTEALAIEVSVETEEMELRRCGTDGGVAVDETIESASLTEERRS